MTFPSRATSLAATAAAAVASALAYPFLPSQVATHFDADGRPDRYGSRLRAAITIPAMMAGMTLVNDRLGAWPGGRDREAAESGVEARDAAIGLVELALLPAHLAILANGAGIRVDMSRVPRGVYGLLMIGLGNVMPKLPRNGLVGIRTPWTLASLPISGKGAARLPLAALLSAVGISVAYSFVEYERRPR